MDATQRFSTRVDHYVRYRPSYPPAVLTTLQEEIGLDQTAVMADIGSGTGLLTKLLLSTGGLVYGVEPNAPMRYAGEAYLADEPRFRSVGGTAEATTLPDQSVDLITAGQAFHWFDRPRTKVEFQRILRLAGHVALVWNSQDSEQSAFMQAYGALAYRYGDDYVHVGHKRQPEAALADFFAPAQVHHATFANEQWFDWEGLRGRALSSSYVPLPDQPHHAPFMAGLRDLYDQYQQNGRVCFCYRTDLYWGQL